MNINFDLNKLIQHGLSFEAWFVLYCLNENKEGDLVNYVKSCRKIPSEIFYKLEEKELIKINKLLVTDEKIVYNALRLTVAGRDLFKIQDFDVLFKELREIYPKEAGKTGRKLHQDLRRCKELYRNIIKDDLSMHNLICICAKLYHNDKKKTGSEDYMQLLPTWLHQRNYEQYIDEAEKHGLETLLEEGGHSEDI